MAEVALGPEVKDSILRIQSIVFADVLVSNGAQVVTKPIEPNAGKNALQMHAEVPTVQLYSAAIQQNKTRMDIELSSTAIAAPPGASLFRLHFQSFYRKRKESCLQFLVVAPVSLDYAFCIFEF